MFPDTFVKSSTHCLCHTSFSSPESFECLHETLGRIEHARNFLVRNTDKTEGAQPRRGDEIVSVDLRPGNFVPRLYEIRRALCTCRTPPGTMYPRRLIQATYNTFQACVTADSKNWTYLVDTR